MQTTANGSPRGLRAAGLTQGGPPDNALVRERKPFNLITVAPTYAVSDWAAARRLADQYVDVARSEGAGALPPQLAYAADQLEVTWEPAADDESGASRSKSS